MDMKDICSAGGDILDAVADAVSRNDFSGLSDNVSSTVSRVVKQVREEAGRGTYGEPTHQYGRTVYTKQGQAGWRNAQKKGFEKYESLYKKRYAADSSKSSSGKQAEQRHLPQAVAARPAGRISGRLQLAWGIFGTSGFGITALVMSIMLAAEGSTVFLVLAAVFGVLTACSITDIVRGSRKIRLVNRFYQYAGLIGNRGYIAVDDLSVQTGQRREDVLRDLRKMMKKRMFLQGRLDHSETTFMITQEAYQQYLQAQHSRMQQEQKEKDRQEERKAKEQEAESGFDQQTKKILADGSAYIRMVHECGEKIRKEEMSYKLAKLEAIMRRIFEQVEKTPESAEDLHKFMDYYLPTTTKLLNAYIDLDRQEIAGANISSTKKEIEDTLDTINIAFENLLDGMFEDTAWDISSDISVMKTMMAQEGLTNEKDFK